MRDVYGVWYMAYTQTSMFSTYTTHMRVIYNVHSVNIIEYRDGAFDTRAICHCASAHAQLALVCIQTILHDLVFTEA